MSNASFSEESKPASLDKPLAPEAPAEPKSRPARRRRRWPLILGVIGAVVLIVLGIPRIIHALNTVSTDDAYVNSHVTFVAPRVIGQVARVLVDDNYRVKMGDVLVELDPEIRQIRSKTHADGTLIGIAQCVAIQSILWLFYENP